MLEKLLNFDRDRTELDEMIALHAFGKTLLATYAEFELEVPDRLGENMTAIGNEIRARARDNYEKAERELMRELEGLKTKEEKKSETEARLARVRQKLGK
jgi:hypothetical protein